MDGYGEDLAAIHAAGFTALASAAARELLPRLEPGTCVLALGCGDGTTAGLLTDAGHRVHCIDSSPARTLRGGYAGGPMPRGLVAYLARKRS